MAKTTSGSYILPGRNSLSFQAKNADAPWEHRHPAGQAINSREIPAESPPRPRLEDLISQLVSLDSKSASTNSNTTGSNTRTTGSIQKPPAATSLPNSPQVKEFTAQAKKAIPAEIRKELNLPASSEAAYNQLLNFYENNRHKPLIESTDGRIIYLEFDLEMQRIRLFTGNQSQKNCMFRNRVESAGYFVIEEVYELRVESHARDILGFKRSEKKVVERYKNGIELLSQSEASDKSIQPVLFFTIYDEKISGVSSSCVKAEKVNK